MAMIKRGKSDGTKPSVIKSSYNCLDCGYVGEPGVCPQCNGVMKETVSYDQNDSPDKSCSGGCPGGCCPINFDE